MHLLRSLPFAATLLAGLTHALPQPPTTTQPDSPMPTGKAFREDGRLHVFYNNGTAAGCLVGGGGWTIEGRNCGHFAFDWSAGSGKNFTLATHSIGGCTFQGVSDAPLVCAPIEGAATFYADGDVLINYKHHRENPYDHYFYTEDLPGDVQPNGLITKDPNNGSGRGGVTLQIRWAPL